MIQPHIRNPNGADVRPYAVSAFAAISSSPAKQSRKPRELKANGRIIHQIEQQVVLFFGYYVGQKFREQRAKRCVAHDHRNVDRDERAA